MSSQRRTGPTPAKRFIDYFLQRRQPEESWQSHGEFVTRKGIHPPLADADKIQDRRDGRARRQHAWPRSARNTENILSINWSDGVLEWCSVGSGNPVLQHSITPVLRNQRGLPMKLYTFFRSSASYRVRIALNLKGHRLRAGADSFAPRRRRATDAGVHERSIRKRSYRRWRTTAGFSPSRWRSSSISKRTIQIRRCCPQTRPTKRWCAAWRMVIACEVHPIQNLRVLNHVKSDIRPDRRAGEPVGAALDRSRPVGVASR